MTLNPKLQPGDKIVLLHMKDETMSPGTKGTVIGVNNIFGEDIYDVEWENGRKLNLLQNEDAWRLQRKRMNEDINKFITNNLDIKYFKPQFLVEYFKDIKDSGIINMFGVAPYLYMGRERIEHEFKYKEFIDEEKEEAFERVLEKADESQSIMIQGCMKVLEKQGKEITVDSINSCLQRKASMMAGFIINLLSMR
jgi:hypothetical protein